MVRVDDTSKEMRFRPVPVATIPCCSNIPGGYPNLSIRLKSRLGLLRFLRFGWYQTRGKAGRLKSGRQENPNQQGRVETTETW